VRLDRERRARGDADGSAEQHVVREDEIGGQELAYGGGVCVDPPLELVPRAVGQPSHVVVAFVAVEHEHREEAAHVGAGRSRSTEVVCLRVGLLAQDGHVVSRACPLARERPRVDVRPCPAEEIAVPEQDAHARILPL
jgi:hypothetical protein